MPRDNKYGKVILENPPEGLTQEQLDSMPCIVFLAKDKTSPDVIDAADDIAVDHGCLEEHSSLLIQTHQDFVEWQDENPDLVKIPDS